MIKANRLRNCSFFIYLVFCSLIWTKSGQSTNLAQDCQQKWWFTAAGSRMNGLAIRPEKSSGKPTFLNNFRVDRYKEPSKQSNHSRDAIWEKRRYLTIGAGVFEPADKEIQDRYGTGPYFGFSIWEMMSNNLGARATGGYYFKGNEHATVSHFLKTSDVTGLWGEFKISVVSIALEAICRARISRRTYLFCGSGMGLFFIKESITARELSPNYGTPSIPILEDTHSEVAGFSVSASVHYWRILCEVNLSSFQDRKQTQLLRSKANLGGVRFTVEVCL